MKIKYKFDLKFRCYFLIKDDYFPHLENLTGHLVLSLTGDQPLIMTTYQYDNSKAK